MAFQLGAEFAFDGCRIGEGVVERFPEPLERAVLRLVDEIVCLPLEADDLLLRTMQYSWSFSSPAARLVASSPSHSISSWSISRRSLAA